MKLSHRIIAYITIALVVLFGVWAFVFYKTSQRRIYGRIDRVLVQQSERIISRFMENDSIPNSLEGASGPIEFFIEKVSPEYAASHPTQVFQTEEYYIDDINDEGTVRELTRLFQKRNIDYELTVTALVFAWSDTLNFALFSILTLAIALLVAIILIVSFIVIRNMRPLYRLTNWLRHHNIGEDIPKPDSHIKAQEFKEIETAVLESAERSQRLFEEQKRFIGNASHEMQTPIAICRNRLELLVDNTELDEAQLTEIEKTLGTLGDLSRLNKSLLLLSKIENHQFKDETNVSINQIAGQAIENLSEIYESMNIKVEVTDRQDITVKMEPSLAKSLVTNLLKNAFVHNKANGIIRVSLADDSIDIGNTGNEQPLDATALFKPFGNLSGKEGSNGLGLAIAKAICNEYGFEISYQFAENQHFFAVRFK